MAIDAKIRNIIEAEGHIKLDKFIQEAMSINSDSYYVKTQEIGNNGDFITSPELSQLFGEMLALWIIEQWQNLGSPTEFCLCELGPGKGSLMNDILRTIDKISNITTSKINIFLFDINPWLIKKQKELLQRYNQKITWIKKLNELPNIPTIIISNEFFDALPIKQYTMIKDKWYEVTLIVDPIDGQIKFDKVEINQALANYLALEHINASDGAVFEESIESLCIFRTICGHISRNSGAIITIDYGYNIDPKIRTRAQYNPTLQAVKDHKYWPIISSIGEADLSSHVDFFALLKTANESGLTDINFLTQRDFLCKYGIITRYNELTKFAVLEEQSILNNQLHRLIDEDKMGLLFKVLEVKSFTEK
ncbi:MAG: SAM-dependent methyltransferase [Rickettsiales bacterium]|nr:SAM-dependent methyltransferase [Rickettsiales bacterium]MCA0254049.1 SAM-dependent methyltransferase [Pseudomonadota bacterium]